MGQGKRFLDKHVLITGGARGIGLEIAAQFLEEGAIVTIFDANQENLSRAATGLHRPGKVYTYLTDVSQHDQVYENVRLADDHLPIDVLINNAGIALETPFLDIAEDEWRKIIDINLTGMFFVAQAVARKMITRKKGVVVNMASKNGLDGEFGYAHYNASKGGVIMLTKTMALELAHYGIRVNAVCPGYIQTPMSIEIDSPEFTANFTGRYIPLNRPGTVSEVAPLFLFLAGEESSFITGQVFIVDGGQLAGQKPGADLLGKIRFGSV